MIDSEKLLFPWPSGARLPAPDADQVGQVLLHALHRGGAGAHLLAWSVPAVWSGVLRCFFPKFVFIFSLR